MKNNKRGMMMNAGFRLMGVAVILMGVVNETSSHLKSIPNAKTVILFAPHPDDDVLGCGGTLIQHINDKSRIILIYLTSGEAAYHTNGRQELAQIREEEAKKAAGMLGIHELIFLKEPDGQLKNSPDTAKKIADLIMQFEPDLIYVPHEGDQHRDHIATNHLVIDAIKTIKESLPMLPLILGYEVWTPIQHFTHVSNISHDIDQKIKALNAHISQIKVMNFSEAVKALNKYRGIMHGHGKPMYAYAECFQEIHIA